MVWLQCITTFHFLFTLNPYLYITLFLEHSNPTGTNTVSHIYVNIGSQGNVNVNVEIPVHGQTWALGTLWFPLWGFCCWRLERVTVIVCLCVWPDWTGRRGVLRCSHIISSLNLFFFCNITFFYRHIVTRRSKRGVQRGGKMSTKMTRLYTTIHEEVSWHKRAPRRLRMCYHDFYYSHMISIIPTW